MEKTEMNKNKICSFYVSKWHLVTMVLPYINKNLNEGIEIKTFLEEDFSEYIKKVLDRLNIKEEGKENILKINWNKSVKNDELEDKIINLTEKTLIIVNGSNNYIENINNMISCDSKNIKILNFYNVAENKDIEKIVKKHTKVLNTSGEKNVEEVFGVLRKCNK